MRRAALSIAATAAVCVANAHAQPAFYQAGVADLPGPPGTIIRQEPMLAGATLGADAYRILYRSTGLNDDPIAVSGVVFVPRAPQPGGLPIVAWAHPTTGVVPRCAPSLALFLDQQIQGIRRMIQRGYIVAATDYPGLGTPGPHPYLVGVSEARAVLDSVRAARSIAGPSGSRRFAVWGHSQGGQAALYAGIIASSYAPELDLAGIAAAAPATELETLMNDDLDSTGGRNLTAMTLWSWARVYGAPIEKVIDPSVTPTIDRLANECIESIFDLIVRGRTERPLERRFLTEKGFAGTEPWRSLLARNTPGTLPPALPVFIAQGTSDGLVRPKVTQDYVAKLCAAGSKVRIVLMPGVNHGFAGRDSADAAVDWMAGRFAGSAPPSDCGR